MLVTLMVVNFKANIIDVQSAKGRPLPPESFVAWNSFSRIGVSDGLIIIDADASTGIARKNWITSR